MRRTRGAKAAFLGAVSALTLGLVATAPGTPASAGSDTLSDCPAHLLAAEEESAEEETTETTTADEEAAVETTAAEAEEEATEEEAAPETTIAEPVLVLDTTPAAEYDTQLDATNVIAINAVPRDELNPGGELVWPVANGPELGTNWNAAHPDGNLADIGRYILGPMQYGVWKSDEGALFTLNTDYVLEFEETDDHLVQTYRLNPEAKWHSGDPITVEDWQATWSVLNGLNPEYQAVSTSGYDLITSVEQGADEFEVVVTYCEPFPDYQGIFGLIGPAESVGVDDPEQFNTGWVDNLNNDWLTGPFEVETLDTTQGIITLVPSDTWWGNPPLLERITYVLTAPGSEPQAFANGTVDVFDIGPDPNGFAIAYNTPDSEIRAAAGPNWRHITMNSGPQGGLVQEQAVRQAIQLGLDRGAIGVSDLAGIPWPAQPLGNHIFVENSAFYVDNSGEWGSYNPDKAREVLEADGWTMGADGFYERDGQRLTVRFSQLEGVPASINESLVTQAQLRDVGIDVQIRLQPISNWGQALTTGDFEVVAFTWLGTAFPFGGVGQIFGNGGASNYANSNIPALDPLIRQLDTTWDPAERAVIANEIDVILWEYGHTIPLYQRPDLWAVNANLANIGAFGYSTTNWEDIGWTNI